MSERAFLLPELTGGVPWAGLDRLPSRPDEFSFVLLSDRTGDARPGVFERAVEITNLLRPDFAIQLGDAIEGYTTDVDELARQWAEFDAITAGLEVPLFRVPGNHDVSNDQMRDHWLHRFGALHYHFVYRDVLVVVLNTQDPPDVFAERFRRGLRVPPETTEVLLSSFAGLKDIDRPAYEAKLRALWDLCNDWEGNLPTALSDEQVAWAERVIREHPDVRWTVLCMHAPAWQADGHDGFDRIRRALRDRPYTAFAGHVHSYRRTEIDGRDCIRLGPAGGAWVQAKHDGSFDAVTLVSIGGEGPRIANLLLDGVRGPDGKPVESTQTASSRTPE